MKILSLLNEGAPLRDRMSALPPPSASIHALLNPVRVDSQPPRKRTPLPTTSPPVPKRLCLTISPAPRATGSAPESALEQPLPPTSPASTAPESDLSSETSSLLQQHTAPQDAKFEYPQSSDDDDSSPESPTTVVSDRFALSRMVGQKHRQKEDVALDLLGLDVTNLQQTHRTFDLSIKAVRSRHGLNQDELRELRALLKAEVRRTHPTLHRVSDATAALLGRRYISGAMAVLMLAQVATRRNLVDLPRAPAGSRRRRNTLECPPESVFEAAIHAAVCTVRNEAVCMYRLEGIPERSWVAIVLEWAIDAHRRWAAVEDATAPPNIFLDSRAWAQAKSTIVRRRRRSIREDARPGDAKRCSRCKRDKTAGSGHPRSHCDDGLEVCSSMPYRAASRAFPAPASC